MSNRNKMVVTWGVCVTDFWFAREFLYWWVYAVRLLWLKPWRCDFLRHYLLTTFSRSAWALPWFARFVEFSGVVPTSFTLSRYTILLKFNSPVQPEACSTVQRQLLCSVIGKETCQFGYPCILLSVILTSFQGHCETVPNSWTWRCILCMIVGSGGWGCTRSCV